MKILMTLFSMRAGFLYRVPLWTTFLASCDHDVTILCNHAHWPNKTGFYMAARRPTAATDVTDLGDLIRRCGTGSASPVDLNEFTLPIPGKALEPPYSNLRGETP